MVKKRGMVRKRTSKKAGKRAKKTISRREICKLCGCHSGKKWEECCGRCILPC